MIMSLFINFKHKYFAKILIIYTAVCQLVQKFGDTSISSLMIFLHGLWPTNLQTGHSFFAICMMCQKKHYLCISLPKSWICSRFFQFLQPILAVLVWNDENFIHTISYSDFLCYQFHINFSSRTSQWKLILSDLVFGPQERSQPWEIR